MEAKRDENRITTLTAALNTDGKTVNLVCADSTKHTLCVDDNTTGDDFSVSEAPRDENRIPVAMAVSSVDGVTPVELYSNDLLKLLINSN